MIIEKEPISDTKRRIVPHNIDAEKSVLSAMTLSLDATATAINKLASESFYKLEHRELFNALIELFDVNQVADLVILEDHLTKKGKLEPAGGIQYISEVINYSSTSANLEYYISLINEKSLFRQLIETSSSILTDCYNPQSDINNLIDLAEKKIFDIAKHHLKKDFVVIRDLIKNSIEKAEQLLNLKESVSGLSTGFSELDKKTLGFQPSDMIVLAARPSMGKTALALNIAEYIAIKQEQAVGIFSLEMAKDQLVFRLLCSNAKISIQKLRAGFISKSEGTVLQLAAGRLAEAPIYVDDTPGITLMELRGKARRLKAKADVKLIIIDYLQLLSSRAIRYEGRQQEISDISRSIKELARELNIPIIILSQLNRAVEQRTDHRPMLSDLRESGAIEQDADVVLLLTRREYYNPEDEPGTADLILAKQRNGPTGEMKLQWNSEYTRFSNLASEAKFSVIKE
ncbi:replicative DNA helicase [bacterium B13(2017)]|nr:replicative DNA helicase [bacterium B13(2017)]